MSTASATCTSANGSLAICESNGDISQSLGITWNGLNGGSSNIYQPALSGGSTPIKNLTFKFNGSNVSYSGNAADYTATIAGNALTISGADKTLQMNDGTGTLTVEFLDIQHRSFDLNVAGFKGNLTILGGGTFTGAIGDFVGNLKILGKEDYGTTPDQGGEGGNIQSYSKSTLSFSGDYTGNIRTGAGTNSFTFSKNNVSFNGDITSSSDYDFYAVASNTFEFSGSTTIGSSSTNKIESNKGSNTITLKGTTNTINSTIITTQNDWTTSTHLNHIIFDTTSAQNNILGTIQAIGGGENKIEFKNASGSSTIGSSKTIDIIDSRWGTNTIIFSGGGTSTIIGNVVTSGNAFFGMSAANTITFSSTGTQQIQGNVIASMGANGTRGTNTITFSNATNATIDGDVIAKFNSVGAGSNVITFNGSGSNTINGKISSNINGRSTIDFTAGTNTIGTNATLGTDVIYADEAINTITSTAGLSIKGNVTAISTMQGIAGVNTITLSGTSNSTIEGNVYAKMKITSGQNNITFNGSGNNAINGFIRADYKGENTIKFTAGTNAIGTDETLGTNVIYANGGTNTITSTSGLSIKGNITTKSTEYIDNNGIRPNSTNTIDISGRSSIQGNIETDYLGYTNIKIKGDNTQSSYLLGNITTENWSDSDNSKINIILDQALWMPTNASTFDPSKTASSGTITNNGGTTTLIYRQGATNVLSSGTANFVINNTSGTTNIITQIGSAGISMSSSINYDSGSVNAIFAKSNDGNSTTITGGVASGATETFDGTTDIANNQFFGLTYKDGVKLSLQDKSIQIGNNNTTILKEYASIYGLQNSHVSIELTRSGTVDTINVSGLAVGNISQLLQGNGGSVIYNVALAKSSVFAGEISLDNTQSTVALTMNDTSKLILTGDNNVMNTLTINGGKIDRVQLATLDTLAQTNNTVIDLASSGSDLGSIKTREDFRVLVVGNNASANTGLQGSGDVAFVSYVNADANQTKAKIGGTEINGKQTSAYADRIVINNAGDNANSLPAGNYYIRLATNSNSNLKSIKYTESTGTADTTNKNIAVATIAQKTNASGIAGKDEASIRSKGVITLQEADTLQGFDVLSGTLKAVETDVNGEVGSGKNGYITYFINSLDTQGADTSVQEASATIAAVNLDLYFANFNSLNKRMGELRDNDNSQGAWARVFGGSQSSSFGLGSKTSYVTTQAGYDYAFGFKGANNYLGVAVAYSHSSSSMNSATNSLNSNLTEGIEGDLVSNMVEVGIYNSYVQDSGCYNDTIAKFSYIMNDFTQSGTAAGNSVSISNMAFTLSDEFGYRFKLGSEKEWYIDPQLEVALGYVMGTDFTQISGLSTLDTKIDSMMQLRARFGSSFGYDFKKFTENKPIKASVYVGAFYEYDYINGGDTTLTTNLGGVNSLQNAISSDGRIVMNVGTNMTIKDNTRIYFDFESSFAGKINTDYQVNVGVRYSFGENTGYTPMTAKKEVAPLKVSEEKIEENKEKENSTDNTPMNNTQQ